jgi:NACalpha-BTF3-like transcription factor
MTSARPRRQGNGSAVDAASIKKVKEVCRESTDEDVKAALIEYNGDVQAAVMSLLDSAFSHRIDVTHIVISV